MNIDGHEFSVPEMVQGKVGDMVVQHYFIVDHSDRLEKYLRDKGYLKEDCTEKEAIPRVSSRQHHFHTTVVQDR